MQLVSDKFKQAVLASGRAITGRVTFEVLDLDAFSDATINVTSAASVSRTSQLTNKVRDISKKYTSYEHNYIKLDGSFTVTPEPDEAPDAELGWWSNEVSDANGNFTIPQAVEFVFTQDHSSMGISIAFDNAANEYAADFDIAAYDSEGALINSVQITGNTSVKYVWMQALDNYRKIEVTVKKWAKAYRRARITEVDFGVVKEYGDNKLVSVNLLQEVDLINEYLPSAELVFTVDNTDKEFNILNPDGFYRFLQEGQAATFELGVEVATDVYEFVTMGTFYLDEWKSDEGSLTTTFTAFDALFLLDNDEMVNASASTKSLYALAEEAFAAAGITNYEIDTALQSINTQSIYPKLTVRQLVRYICLAGRAVAYVDRTGKIIIKQLVASAAITDITFSHIYKEPQLRLDSLIKRIEVSVYNNGSVASTYTLDNNQPKGKVYKIDNPLIDSITVAQDVAQWVLGILTQRILFKVDWRQNPALDILDIVNVQSAYGSSTPARVFKQEFNYQGYLGGVTELRG